MTSSRFSSSSGVVVIVIAHCLVDVYRLEATSVRSHYQGRLLEHEEERAAPSSPWPANPAGFPPAQPRYGNAVELTLQKCDGEDPWRSNPSLLWSWNATGDHQLVQTASSSDGMSVYFNYPPFRSKGSKRKDGIVLWQLDEPHGRYGNNYRWQWNDTLETFQEFNHSERYLGYTEDSEEGDVVLYDCSPPPPATPVPSSTTPSPSEDNHSTTTTTTTTMAPPTPIPTTPAPTPPPHNTSCTNATILASHTRWTRVFVGGLVPIPGHGGPQGRNVTLLRSFMLRSPNGLCLSPVPRWNESYVLESKQWSLRFGTSGYGKKYNYTSLVELKIWQPTFNTWSQNLLLSYASSAPQNQPDWLTSTSITYFERNSSTGNVSSNSSWAMGSGGRFVKPLLSAATSISGDNSLRIEGIKIGDTAEETWTISLVEGEGGNSSSIRWETERAYLKTIVQESSRYSNIILRPGDNPPTWRTKKDTNFIGTLDSTFQRNNSISEHHKSGPGPRTDYAAPSSFYQRYNDQNWVYANSLKSENWITFSPADVCVPWQIQVDDEKLEDQQQQQEIKFAMQWAAGVEGYPFPTAVGLISTHKDPIEVLAGTRVSASLTLSTTTLDHSACESGHRLTFNTDSKDRDETTQALARVFFMWAGNIISNSPSSKTVLFESAYFALMASIFDPPQMNISSSNHRTSSSPLGDMPELFHSLRYEYDFFLSDLTNKTTGEITSMWTEQGPDPYAGQTMWQQQTSVLYGFYIYTTITGDKDLVLKHWEGAIKKAFGFLLYDLGVAEEGLMHCLNSNGNNQTNATDCRSQLACNWLDVIGFGHYDGIINSELAIVLQGYSEMATWIGDVETAKAFKELWKTTVKTYNDKLWNETLGLYSDWIGLDGKRHSYGYIWQQGNAVNMLSGIVGTNDTRRDMMCDALDSLYKYIFNASNTTEEVVFATPTNFISVPSAYQTTCQLPYQPHLDYENGGLFTSMPPYEMKVRFACGQVDIALKLYDRLLEEFKKDRLWGQNYHWFSKEWEVGDVLTNTVTLITGLLRYGMRVRPTLTEEGVLIDGDPGPLYEGWSWSFWAMGERHTATVSQGKTIITKTPPPPRRE